MFKIRKLLPLTILVLFAFGLQACAQKPAPEESCNFVQNSEQQRVSWGAQTPVTLYVDPSVPSVYNDAVLAAAEVWNKAVGRDVLKIVIGADTNPNPGQDGHNVIYYLKTWERDRSNEQARTTVYWSGDRIYEADVRINARDFDFFWGDEVNQGRVDMESLLVHEFGHVLGLAHAVTPQSVMVRSLPSAVKRRALSDDDRKSIRCEY